MQERHHAAHPFSGVKPNANINPKPNYVAPERAANVIPSGPVGVDGVNARKPTMRQDNDACDPEFDDCGDATLDPEDRITSKAKHIS